MKKITYAEFLTRQEKNKNSKSKYKNKKVWIDGYVFDSIIEGKRYNQLKLLEKNGVIQSLELQPTFLLHDTLRVLKNGKKETYRKSVYKADFAYTENGLYIVNDTKGMETETYKLKRKEFLLKDYCDVFMEIKHNKIIDYIKEK